MKMFKFQSNKKENLKDLLLTLAEITIALLVVFAIIIVGSIYFNHF